MGGAPPLEPGGGARHLGDAMELSPVPFATVQRSLSGRLVNIDPELNHILAKLVAIDPRFRARFNEREGTFVLYLCDEHEETLVGIYSEWDERVVRRALEFTHPGYNFAEEADRREREDQRRHDADMHEKAGEVGERLRWAMRKDLGLTDRAFIPDKDAA